MDPAVSESCRASGACHRARNCVNGTCAETGKCQSTRPAEAEHRCPTLDEAFGCTICNAGARQLVQAIETRALQPAAILPTDKQARKNMPICTGVLDYFSAALAEIAKVSKAGNDQHNPGQPLHWARGKSMDHADCITRHLMERGTIDDDGMRHSAKMAWRALALLQQELEDAGAPISRASK